MMSSLIKRYMALVTTQLPYGFIFVSFRNGQSTCTLNFDLSLHIAFLNLLDCALPPYRSVLWVLSISISVDILPPAILLESLLGNRMAAVLSHSSGNNT